MDNNRLSQQVNLYLQWRKDIVRQLTRYRTWLNDSKLHSTEVENRLNEAFDIIKKDEIKLAFVGEFSRGKTELINALFFSQYGVRILPSGGGRTTMCPTELFYDHKEDRNYIRLLPIETRLGGSSISSFKQIPDHWVYVPLNPDDPKILKKAFTEVASVKAVKIEDAASMGFQPEILEPVENDPARVYVPSWRHALISFDHPLLRQGLTLIDTPGLNALGCEPELTFRLLPEAHGILFLLSASTGVSGTDLEIWNRHIRDLSLQETTGVFAILNKIDSIWDPLESEERNKEILDQMRAQCARHLSIAPDEILTVSAKQGLLAKITNDQQGLEKSNLPALESLLSEDLTHRKELILKNKVVKDIVTMLHGSRKMLKRRRESLMEQIDTFKGNFEDCKQQLEDLQNHTKAEQAFYHKKLIMMKTSRKVVERDGASMLEIVNQENLEQYRQEAGKALTSSWTIVGMNNAIDVFFTHLKQDMEQAAEQQALIQKNIANIYAQYEAEQGLAPIDYVRFDAKKFQTRLDDLRNKSGSFRRNLKKLITEQKSTSKRFFLTIATEASNIYRQFRKEARHWLNDVLLPIFQNVQEQKQFLDEQVVKLKSLAYEGQDAVEKTRQLKLLLTQINTQLEQADEILAALRKPAPFERSKKVVQFPPPAQTGNQTTGP